MNSLFTTSPSFANCPLSAISCSTVHKIARPQCIENVQPEQSNTPISSSRNVSLPFLCSVSAEGENRATIRTIAMRKEGDPERSRASRVANRPRSRALYSDAYQYRKHGECDVDTSF